VKRKSLALSGEELTDSFRSQKEWAWLIAFAFFSGEVGAGLFFLSMLYGHAMGAAIGLAIVAVCKNGAHLLYLGKPLRFWRAVAHPQSSWISRGLIALGVFMVFGFLAVLSQFSATSWTIFATDTLVGRTIWLVAVLSALILMIYDGLVMAYPPSIALWHTPFVPVLCLTYSLLGGATVLLFLVHLGLGTASVDMHSLAPMELALIIANLLLLLAYLVTRLRARAAAREAVLLLSKGRYALPFVGGVIVVGLLGTLVFSLFFSLTHLFFFLYLVAAAELIGDFLLRFSLLKAGVFSPVLPLSIKRRDASI